MCARACMCIYLCLCELVYVHKETATSRCVLVWRSIYMHMHIDTRTCVFIYKNVYTYCTDLVSLDLLLYFYVHIYIYIYIFIHIQIHKYMNI